MTWQSNCLECYQQFVQLFVNIFILFTTIGVFESVTIGSVIMITSVLVIVVILYGRLTYHKHTTHTTYIPYTYHIHTSHHTYLLGFHNSLTLTHCLLQVILLAFKITYIVLLNALYLMFCLAKRCYCFVSVLSINTIIVSKMRVYYNIFPIFLLLCSFPKKIFTKIIQQFYRKITNCNLLLKFLWW